MNAASPHNTIIGSVARAKLRPLGILQKGRSRFWFDDRRWHAISIEFQPSGFNRGSYLNVAVSWLWYRKEHWSFDLPHEARPWVEFHDAAQFQRDCEALVDEALAAVHDFRARTATLQSAYEGVRQMCKALPRPGGWPDVHLALLAALTGRGELAARLLRSVADQECRHEAQERQSAFCEQALSLLQNADGLRAWVEQNISDCRRLLGMPPLEEPTLPAQ